MSAVCPECEEGNVYINEKQIVHHTITPSIVDKGEDVGRYAMATIGDMEESAENGGAYIDTLEQYAECTHCQQKFEIENFADGIYIYLDAPITEIKKEVN